MALPEVQPPTAARQTVVQDAGFAILGKIQDQLTDLDDAEYHPHEETANRLGTLSQQLQRFADLVQAQAVAVGATAEQAVQLRAEVLGEPVPASMPTAPQPQGGTHG
jgi:hypothetical protein